VLLAVSDQKMQFEIAKKIRDEKMSVRQLEKIVGGLNIKKLSPKENMTEKNMSERLILGLAEELQKRLGTKVSIDYSNAKGKISIHFYSDEELTQIVDRLKESHGKH
jgi:ParB family chromosome partitioning protein